MFVVLCALTALGKTLGQDVNIQNSSVEATPASPSATEAAGVLQLLNSTSTTLKIELSYNSSLFPDINWFNVFYWPTSGSQNCPQKAFNDKQERHMVQIKVTHTKPSWHSFPNRFAIIKPVLDLAGLHPGKTYLVCVESNEYKPNSSLSWCNCSSSFSTQNDIGKVQYLYLSKRIKNHVTIEWTAPAGFENGDDIYNFNYQICPSSNRRSCTNQTDTKLDLPLNKLFSGEQVCVSAWLAGQTSKEECINAEDSVSRELNINVSMDGRALFVNFESADNNSYVVYATCNDALPICNKASDCSPIKASDSDGLFSYVINGVEERSSYKILVYGEDEDGNEILLATTIYEPTFSGTEDDSLKKDISPDSIIIIWVRPWHLDGALTIINNVTGTDRSSNGLIYENFMGCELQMEVKTLKPFSNYTGSFTVTTTRGRYAGIDKDYTFKTSPGVCENVEQIGSEKIIFKQRKIANPVVTFRLPAIRTGEIDRFHFILKSPDGKKFAEEEGHMSQCANDTICKIKLDMEVQPDQTYSLVISCRNKNSTLAGKETTFSLITDPAVPEAGKNVLDIDSLKFRNGSSNYLTLTINSAELDWLAGVIRRGILCYGREGSLHNVPSDYTSNSSIPRCANNKMVNFESNKTKSIKIYEFFYNENYEAVIYYNNSKAFAYTKILHFRTPENPRHAIVAVCFIILIFIILSLLSMYFSRREKTCTKSLTLPDLEFDPSSLEGEEFHHPISKILWRDQLQALLCEPKMEIKKEFFSLSQKRIHGDCHPSTRIAESQANLNKNRYFDIIPYDFSRVILNDLPETDHENYINATYIHSYNVNCGFIACQGPKESTVHDFWRMIVEKNVRVIVMLTRCVEGREKCYKYWPSVTPLITSSKTSIQPLQDMTDPSGDYTIRKFLVSQGWDTQEVVQFHFTAWPDKKCPKTANFYSFISEVKSSGLSQNSPVVVHCSAGVGRTGSFIALYNLMDEMNDPEKDSVDIYYQVLKMRCFRNYMVQTQSQYIFLYESIFQLFKDNSGELSQKNSLDRLSDFDELSEDEESGIAEL